MNLLRWIAACVSSIGMNRLKHPPTSPAFTPGRRWHSKHPFDRYRGATYLKTFLPLRVSVWKTPSDLPALNRPSAADSMLSGALAGSK